jgi:pathogen-inducible salicylic acid glucosyltransferase
MPMMSVPQWTDQSTNTKYIIDAWHVGVRVKVNEKEIATKKEIERCTREVMER